MNQYKVGEEFEKNWIIAYIHHWEDCLDIDLIEKSTGNRGYVRVFPRTSNQETLIEKIWRILTSSL